METPEQKTARELSQRRRKKMVYMPRIDGPEGEQVASLPSGVKYAITERGWVKLK